MQRLRTDKKGQLKMWRLRYIRKRLRCRNVCLFLIIGVLCAIYYFYTLSTCSEAKSIEFLQNLCDDYHSNKAAGSLCSSLCDSKSLQYEQCTNYPQGKVVMFLECRDCRFIDNANRVVLKARTGDDHEEYGQAPPYPVDKGERTFQDYVNMISSVVRSHFSNNLNYSIPQETDILSYAWGWDFNKFAQKSGLEKSLAVQVAYENILSLIRQSEYMFTRALQNYTYIPRVYGTCGNAYFVEFTETLHTLEFNFGIKTFSKWRERATIALKLIDLFRHLDTDFTQPLHLCDVKPDNFGKGHNSQVTLIDTDCAFFHSQLMSQFHYSNCSAHEDCDFFDCRGLCDKGTGRCKLKRTNNNMQCLCEDVFQGFSPKIPTGLLRDPPESIRHELVKTLEACAYPDNQLKRHYSRQPAPDSAVKKLEEILRLSLKDSNL